MNSDTPIDYAFFQLSPRRSRCELFVSGYGKTEKLASGLLKPFLAHLKVAEEQAANSVQSIKLDIDRRKNAAAWFNKGTLERFVRFVSTPEVLELVNTFDAEMSQLEGARRIYAQGAGDQQVNASGGNETSTAAAADITKKELLRAIDLRLAALKQDLVVASARASAAGFTLDNATELLLFSDRFGAPRLNEACTKFISLCQRRPELISHRNQLPPQANYPQSAQQWKGFNDESIRSSSGSDMSIDEEVEQSFSAKPLLTDAGIASNPASNSETQSSETQRAASEPPPTSQQTKPFSCRFVEKMVEKEDHEESANSTPLVEQSEPSSDRLARRLSLKDRISFFENKQKEQASGASSITSGPTSGNRGVGGKAELKRLPSDISAEKSVLRRWSGASDMSIELGSSDSRKDGESVTNTPTSSALSVTRSGNITDDKEVGGMKNAGVPLSDSISSMSSMFQSEGAFDTNRGQSSQQLSKEDDTNFMIQSLSAMVERGNSNATSEREQQACQANHDAAPPMPSKSNFVDSSEPVELDDQFKAGLQDHHREKGLNSCKVIARTDSSFTEQMERQNKRGLSSQSKNLYNRADSIMKEQPTLATEPGTSLGNIEETFVKPQVQFRSKASPRNTEGRMPRVDRSQHQRKISLGSTEEVGRKHSSSYVEVEEEEQYAPQGPKLHGHNSDAYDADGLQRMRADAVTVPGSTSSAGRKAKEVTGMSHSLSTSSLDQGVMGKPSKGCQQLNDELQMKADELEKLFAAHKRRVNGDQIAPSRKSKHQESQIGHVVRVEKKPVQPLPDTLVERNNSGDVFGKGMELDPTLLLKMVDSSEYAFSTNMLGNASEEQRGIYYERYMQKRDAKLKEEWGSKRAQKEAKMKVMHDSLERSHTEMKAKFAASPEQRSLAISCRRAEKLRAYHVHATKSPSQKIEASLPEEEDVEEASEQVCYGEDKSHIDAQCSDGYSRSSISRKTASGKNLSPATSDISPAPISRPTVKTATSGTTRRRAQSENPLAQSVPNFSDLRKENTKAPVGGSKTSNRVHTQTCSQSRSSIEETKIVNEDKPLRSESMRKGSASLGESKDLSPLNYDSPNTMSSFTQQENSQQGALSKVQKINEKKPFLRKGTGVAVNVNFPKDEIESEGLLENSLDMDKDGNISDRASVEGFVNLTEFPTKSANIKPRLSQVSDTSGELDPENVRSPYHDTDDATAQLDGSIANRHESPKQSPGYWKSHVNDLFSYTHETSDVDAFVDSPSASLASWNSYPSNQIMEIDASRMRKKWGTAHIPVFAANTSHQPHREVPKGFKRLLKFGRKNRGPETIVTDYVSTSTASEGDDDIEDRHGVLVQASNDLQKSRMGYERPATNAFSECDAFLDQVQPVRSSIPTPPASIKLRDGHLSGSALKAPRSFFSLSNFRSEGSESKLR